MSRAPPSASSPAASPPPSGSAWRSPRRRPPPGRFAAAERPGRARAAPPPTTALGALLGHITGGADARTFQPMNVNFGLFPPLPGGAITPATRGEKKTLL